MPKKRKTRQEKIILQLKRELAKKSQAPAPASTKSKPSQEAVSQPTQAGTQRHRTGKKSDNPVFSYDSRLVKKGLLKTFILTIIILSLEFMLYLKLR